MDPDARIEDISVGMQQRVEILKMLYRDNEVLIFDSPTAVLTPQEIDELMDIMRCLQERRQVHPVHHPQAGGDQGRGGPVQRPAEGQVHGYRGRSHHQWEEMSRLMVGRDVELVTHKQPKGPGEVILDVKNLTVPPRPIKTMP